MAPELNAGVTRRDFVNTALAGAGATLLHAPSPADAAPASGWNGYGGVGDYRRSNGDTAEVTRSAHRIRDHLYDGKFAGVTDTGETYDLVIVGGGFTGVGALLEFHKRRPEGRCLLLDNQAVFGGYAKANEFEVDGYRIAGGQASLNFILPETPQARADSYWTELGMPERFRFADREGGDPSIVFQKSTSGTLYHGEQSATSGYWSEASVRPGGGWVKDVWADDLARAPWSAADKRALLALRDHKRRGKPDAAEAARLDAMTFADWATREMAATPEVLAYMTQGMCITGPQISALAAQSLPGLDRFAPGSPGAELADRFISFPGGNTALARHFVKAVFPGAIGGPNTFEAIASAPLDLAALDRKSAPRRMRLGATAVRVEHDGDPQTADRVHVIYEKGGRLYRVTAGAVVLGIGAWVSKHIVADLPTERRAALDSFLYAPILIVNVALTNWRFLDRLGFSTARWSDGFGFYAAIRRPMVVGGRSAPFHPDKPIVMTLYVPFQNPDLPLEAQGPAGRAQLLGTSYADYEAEVVRQMQRMFSSGGFDARRDVAGIVLNRWGHAFVTPPPGFFHGQGDRPAPLEVARKPFGRIAFGQSGLEDWLGAAHAGRRAVGEMAAAF